MSSPAFYLHRKIFDFPHSNQKGSDENQRFPYIISETIYAPIGTANRQALRGIDSLNGSLITATKGFRFSGSGWHINRPEVARIGTWNSDANDIELSNDLLKVVREDSVQTLEKWVLIYKSYNTNSQYQKILHQLSIDTNYIAQLRSKLRSSKLRELTYEDSRTSLEVASSKDFGTYELIRIGKAVKESRSLIKVDELTYLKKKY